jgi:hypothetical protein
MVGGINGPNPCISILSLIRSITFIRGCQSGDRGAYFFLDEEGKILREIYRILKEDGLAFIGGGYGKNTPQVLIDEIADESRDLNDRLGRKRVTEGEVTGMVNKAGLASQAKIEKEGGLWLLIQKWTVGHHSS